MKISDVTQQEFWKDVSVNLSNVAINFGLKLLGALVIWFIGRKLILFASKVVGESRLFSKVDETVRRYVRSAIEIVLTFALIIALLGYFGVQTTTFAALLAAAGVAIGMAWSGLLSNFASGLFLLLLRPFQHGDFVEGGGITGTVEEIGLFVTKINTPDNICTFIGNDKIFKGVIKNYSANPYRRVDLVAQLHHGVDHREAIELLTAKLREIPNVLDTPAPDLVILEFNLAGPVLAVRPYCHTDHYWQVYFDANETIRDVFGAAGFPTPSKHIYMEGNVQTFAPAV